MFTGNQGGDGEQAQVPNSESPSVGIRDLGLNEMEGGWCIPAIPTNLFRQEVRLGAEDRLLASFSLHAHQHGLRLPKGEFVDIAQTVQSQLESYYRRFRISAPLPISLVATLENGTLTLAGFPEMDLPLIYLKQVFEELECLQAGLGHFVTESISDGHGIGMTTYDPIRLMSGACYSMFYGAETDLQMVAEMHAHGEFEEDTTPEELLKTLRNEYPIIPSDLVKAMGPVLSAPPKKHLSISRAKAALSGAVLSEVATRVLRHAIRFRALRRKLDRLKLDFFVESETEQVGALAFVVWDCAGLAQEVVNHVEQAAYECEGEELLFRLHFDLNDRSTWDRAIESYKLLVRAYVALSELLVPMEHKE